MSATKRLKKREIDQLPYKLNEERFPTAALILMSFIAHLTAIRGSQVCGLSSVFVGRAR
jgi:hypothetical protein